MSFILYRDTNLTWRCRLLPESPRWLVSRGRIKEASAIVRHAAHVNKADVSDKILNLQDLQESESPQEKFWHLFKSPRLMIRCLVIFFNWWVLLKFERSLVQVNPYVGHLLSGVVDECLSKWLLINTVLLWHRSRVSSFIYKNIETSDICWS